MTALTLTAPRADLIWSRKQRALVLAQMKREVAEQKVLPALAAEPDKRARKRADRECIRQTGER